MAVPIDPVEDDRAERILSDPDKYFAEERERVRAEVIEEMWRDGRAIASRAILDRNGAEMSQLASVHIVGRDYHPVKNAVCDACDEPLRDGQRIYSLIHSVTPWLPEDDEYQEYGGFAWHVDCDKGSLAADGAA